MSHAIPTLRIFAASLIGHEAEVNLPSPAENPTVLPVIEKLRPVLAPLMGRVGFRALLCRALEWARLEVPWLGDVEVGEDGRMGNFAGLAAQQKASEVTEGSEVLLAHLLGLLVAFIGEVLTLRLIHQIWPNVPKDDDFTQDNSQNFHEQAN